MALQNPYVDRLSETLQLFYQNAPAPMRKSKSLNVMSAKNERFLCFAQMRMDRFLVPVQSGHDYLIDSVVLREFASEEKTDLFGKACGQH